MLENDDTSRLPKSLPPSEAVPDDFELRGMFALGARDWRPPSAEEIQHMLPQYEVKAFVARGGMGAVYRGVHRALEREVAIKIMPPNIEHDELQFAERFKAEAKAMARLEHPSIVAVHDAGETPDGLLYFVMEFVRGTDVQEIIAKEGKVEPGRALEITCAVLDALVFAHESGIIHRDIKPSNVMFDTKGRVKVADFGLAKAVDSDNAGFTGSEVMLGTADFIAPEASIKGIKLDARADIYAVGVMLYVMLTGKIPRGRFEMPTALLPKIDPRLDAIVDKAMQTDRDKRYASAAEMRAAVGKVIAETRIGAMPKPGASAAKAKFGLVPVAVSAVVVIAAASFFVSRKPAPVVKPEVAGTPAAKPVAAAQETWTDAVPELLKTNPTKVQPTPEGLRLGTGVGFGPRLRDSALRVTLPQMEKNFTISVRSTGRHVGTSYEQYSANFFAEGWVALTRYGMENDPKTQLARATLPGFDPKAKHSLELRVVGDRLTVLVDGKQLIDERDATYSEGKFSITGYDNTFEKVEYARLDGGAAPPPAAEKWVDRLAEWFTPSNTSMARLTRLTDGTARAEATNGTPVISKPVRDAAVRAVAHGFEKHIALGLRGGKLVNGRLEGYAAAIDARGYVELACFRPGTTEHDVLTTAKVPGLDPQASHTLEFRAVGDRLTVQVDGKQVIERHDSTYTQGTSAFVTEPGTIIEKLEYAILDP